MAEPGIDFDLDHLHRTRHAGADRHVGEPAHHPAEDPAHECPTSFSGDATPGAICLLSSGRTPDAREIGRGREQLAPRRVGAGRRLSLCVLLDRGLQLLHREQRRRHHRGGGAAAARARAFRQVGIADPDLDLVRLEAEFARDRIGDHGAAAGADILDRGARDQASALDRHFDLRAGLPEIKPVAGGDADAAAIAAGLRRRCLPVAPDVEPERPIVEPLAVGIGDPSVCAARSDRPSSAARLRRSPVPARTPSAVRRARGTPRRAADC